jgi:aminomethyltransferase
MEENLLKTCLYDKHVALGALMSPFGGFIMPIQYTNITEEHNAVRQHAGMFDVSHMGEIFVSGPDAEKFVNHIFTNNVTGIPDGKILYGMMLYPSGTVVDDLLVYKEFEPCRYLLVVNASNIAKDYEWICAQKEGFDVEVVNASDSWGEIALQGPEAEKFAVETLGLAPAEKISSSLVFSTRVTI